MPPVFNRTSIKFALGFIALIALSFAVIIFTGLYAPGNVSEGDTDDAHAAPAADCVTAEGKRC